MTPNQSGYALVSICIFVPIVFLTIGTVAFSLIKTDYNSHIKGTCQINLHDYFNSVREKIQFIESLSPVAVTLYQTQMALLPLTWYPPAMKIYQNIQKLRAKMDRFQRKTLQVFNLSNMKRSVQAFFNIRNKALSLNQKSEKTLRHDSFLSFQVNPRLQLEKRMNITFPPYERSKDIYTKQKFSVSFRNRIRPLSSMKFFNFKNLNESYLCEASLHSEPKAKLSIKYTI